MDINIPKRAETIPRRRSGGKTPRRGSQSTLLRAPSRRGYQIVDGERFPERHVLVRLLVLAALLVAAWWFAPGH